MGVALARWGFEVTSPARFIGRCKSCKGVARIEAPEVGRRKVSLGYGRTETRIDRVTPNGARVEGYDRFFLVCLCGRHVEFRKIRGVFSERKQCNARCMSSHGPSCECSCAGENHGASFGA